MGFPSLSYVPTTHTGVGYTRISPRRIFSSHLLSLPFAAPIIRSNLRKEVISPRSPECVLGWKAFAKSLGDSNHFTVLVLSCKFRILATLAISFHPSHPLSGLALRSLNLSPTLDNFQVRIPAVFAVRDRCPSSANACGVSSFKLLWGRCSLQSWRPS